MRLIFLNRFFHPDESATSQLLTDLCTHVAHMGHEVHVITSRQLHDDPRARLAISESHKGIHVHRVRTTSFGRMNLVGRANDYATFYLTAAASLWRLARQGDVVIAETDPPLISVVAAWICHMRRARLVNWVQDVFPEVAQRLGVPAANGLPGRMLTALRDHSLRFASTNVALGDLMAEQLRQRAPTVPTLVLHNWADGRSVRPVDVAENSLREEWGLGDRFVVGYSGNMGRAHEFATLLQACELLREQSEIVFVLIGGGPQHALIEQRATQRGLGNLLFRPLQPRECLAESLSVPDVHLVTLQPALEGLVVPSKFYGIAAAGRPTIFIGSRGGEIARLVDRGGCGIAIAPGDGARLAATIKRMSADRAATLAMGNRARAFFEREFDICRALPRWEALLREVKQGRPPKLPM